MRVISNRVRDQGFVTAATFLKHIYSCDGQDSMFRKCGIALVLTSQLKLAPCPLLLVSFGTD